MLSINKMETQLIFVILGSYKDENNSLTLMI